MTTQNLALDISSVKLQIASVTKLHPKASPAYPTVWGVSKEAPSCYEQQHCALSKVESSWRVTAWKLYLIKTQRSLGFMPRVWRSLFQNKNYCFVVLALHAKTSSTWFVPPHGNGWRGWRAGLARGTEEPAQGALGSSTAPMPGLPLPAPSRWTGWAGCKQNSPSHLPSYKGFHLLTLGTIPYTSKHQEQQILPEVMKIILLFEKFYYITQIYV